MKLLLGAAAAAAIAGAGWYWYAGNEKPDTGGEVFGTYAYSCDTGVTFEMTLWSDISSVMLKAQGDAPFGEVTLEQKPGPVYATADDEVVLVGEGETIHLTVGAATMTCNPVPSDDMAPFHWGGEGEGPDPDPSEY